MEKLISKSQLEQICLKIRCGDVNGTAFYISEDIVLTARHNVIDSINKGVSIEIEETEHQSESIISEDAQLDICLIKVETKSFNYVPLIETQLFFQQNCNIYGFPNYSDKNGQHFEGNIHALPNERPYDISLKIKGIEDYDYSGLSGAPVLMDGKLIGVARLQINDEIGVVSFAKAKGFLEANTINIIEDSETRNIPEKIEESVISAITNHKTSNKLNKALEGKNKWLLCSGSPGAGKTTFIAKFAPDNDEVFLCGKYFIKIPNDNEALEIRTSVRSILSWLEITVSKVLGINIDLLDKIEDRIKRIKTMFSTLSTSGISGKYLLIIDGLDEVKNLESFLGVFPINIPENIHVIISCTNKDILPSNIQNEISDENEIQIEPLELGPCETYIQDKLIKEGVTAEIVQKLAVKSEGHPLYLNYLINSLNDLGVDNEDEIEKWIDENPSIGGDIEKYYKSIWNSFFKSPEKLWLVSTISQFRNPVSEKLLVNCLPKNHKQSFYSEFPQIKYLTNGTDNYELYHRSFKNFIGKKVPEILPSINDNIFEYCDLNRKDIYSIENWLFHKQHGTKSKESIKYCNQDWADHLCLNHINPELIIQDIKGSIIKAVEFKLMSEVIRVLLLLQRIEFRYDSLFAENSFEVCKSMISMGEFPASLSYLVREGKLLVSEYDALYFLQQYYENNAISEGDQLLEVLESRFRLYLENEFTKPKDGFSLLPFQIMIQAFALSVHSKGKKAILNCLNLTEDLRRFQDLAKKDGAIEASEGFLYTRTIGSAWLNAYTLRCYDSYVPLDQIKKMSKENIDKTWIHVISLSVLLYRELDNYDTLKYDKTENYYNLISDIEWLVDEFGIEDDINLIKTALRALIYDSSRTDIIEALITRVLEVQEDYTGLFKNKNGVDVNFKKLISDEFRFLYEGFRIKENSFKELESRRGDWESYLYSVFEEVNLLEGKILRCKSHTSNFEMTDCRKHLNNIISSLNFSLSERAHWDRSYLIPEDILPLVFAKTTSLYLSHFPDELKWYTNYLKSRYDDQFGLYNEGYRATLIKIIEQFIHFGIEEDETIDLIDTLSNFTIKNIENRWERTPELLVINQFYCLVGEYEKAKNIFVEAMKTSMGPSWYKESQFSILNTAFSLSSNEEDLITSTSRVAYLLNEAAGEMTFQRYVRHAKESFIGLLAKKGFYRKAIELLKFETIPPFKALVEGAEFYSFDLISRGAGYSYGARNISIESAVLELVNKINLNSPELKVGLAFIFSLHNEVFRHISEFGKIIGENLNLISTPELKHIVFSWINEISSSPKIKDEKRNFVYAIDSYLSISHKKDFNDWAKEKDIDIQFNVVEQEPIGKEKDKVTEEISHFKEFNEKHRKNTFKTDTQMMQEAKLTFSKEKVSIWMGRRWSSSSKATRAIIKNNIKDSSHLLQIFEEFLGNIDEEAWDIADDLIWFGNKIFSPEESNDIRENIYHHIDLLVYREKTMKDRYSWLNKEEQTDSADNEVFKLLIWLMNFPEKDVQVKSTVVVDQLINQNEGFLILVLKEVIKINSINLRIKLFKMILRLSKSNPNKVGTAFSKINLGSLLGNLDLISSKFLKDIGEALNSSDFTNLSNQIAAKFSDDNNESRDVYFEDDRFECVRFIIEDLIEHELMTPSICRYLEETYIKGFSEKEIEMLKKSNLYMRQSFRESIGLEDNYYNSAIATLNESIMPIIKLENMDRVYEIINC